jgi:F-type H+-transporting ATPase subunit b
MRSLGRRAALAVCLVLGAPWGLAHAQTSAEKAVKNAVDEPATRSEGRAEGVSPIWSWANFAILAGGLGYLTKKYGGPWFASRSLAIRKGIADAEQIRAAAEGRAAEVDRKLAGLHPEIESLKADAHREQAAETERLRQQTAADMARVQAHAASEIEAAGKAARLQLKRYAAQLAIDLAEQKIRRQITPDVQTALVENFARELQPPPGGPHLSK